MENSDYPNVAKGSGIIVLKRNTVANLFRLMRRGRARAGSYLTEHVTDSGTFIIGSPSSFTPPYPFQVSIESTATTAQLGVRFGSVNDFINDPFSPPGMVESNEPLYVVKAAVGNTVCYLKVNVETDLADPDYGEILSVDNPAVANTLPANDWATGAYYIRLITFAVNGATTPPTITLNDQDAKGSQGFKLSGESGLYWSLGG